MTADQCGWVKITQLEGQIRCGLVVGHLGAHSMETHDRAIQPDPRYVSA
jgi:hypothetical protein